MPTTPPPCPRVPDDLLRALPTGIACVRRQDREFLVAERVCCPAGHSLMDDAVRIHGVPSIKFAVDTGSGHGHIYVDAVWGGHDKLYDFMPTAPSAQPLVASCPHCGSSLNIPWRCARPGCGSASAILLALPGGRNRILVCARLGCAGHHLDAEGVEPGAVAAIDDIHYFGFVDDLFGGI